MNLLSFARSANYASLVTAQLVVLASHMVLFWLFLNFYVTFCYLIEAKSYHFMLHTETLLMKAGLGLPDIDAWYMIETIAERNSIGSKQFVS